MAAKLEEKRGRRRRDTARVVRARAHEAKAAWRGEAAPGRWRKLSPWTCNCHKRKHGQPGRGAGIHYVFESNPIRRRRHADRLLVRELCLCSIGR